jgi:hypothetical protein
MIHTLLIAVLVVSFGCQPTPDAFLEIDGWSPQGEPSTYDADGLWEVINGAADVFLSHGFHGLTAQQFVAGDLTVNVNVYDMGTPLNAFGIYRTEAPPDVPALDIGAEAVLSPPYQCLLLKDRYYVKVEAYEGDIDDASGRSLVEGIAQALPGTEDPPPSLAALPSDGMVPGSSRYTKEDLFGLGELDEVVYASYLDEQGTEYHTIVKLPAAGGTIDSAWDDLAQRWELTDLGDQPVLYRQVPYEGYIGVVRGDAGLIGVAGCQSEEELLQRLARFLP